MEWELSKENVQPLRKGRNVEILNETLQVKEKSKDQSKILDSQRRFNHSPFENSYDRIRYSQELRNLWRILYDIIAILSPVLSDTRLLPLKCVQYGGRPKRLL